MVALVFRGLVRLGPGDSILPDLAERWTTEQEGQRWTFVLRQDARWQDGQPVTAEDVALTVRALQAPGSTSPAADTWRQVVATVVDERTVRFDLAAPTTGFLDAMRQPLLPAHLLGSVPVEALADDPFWRAPIGTGRFALVQWDERSAVLEPVAPLPPDLSRPFATFPARRLTGSGSTLMPRLELRFFQTAEELAAAVRAGEVDSAAELSGAPATGLVGSGDNLRLLRYPGTTLTSVVLNLRPGAQPAFGDARTRRGLLAAIDRDGIVAETLAGTGKRADSPIPPVSWAFDRSASKPIAHDNTAAAADLRAAGWSRSGGRWTAPRGKSPFEMELLAPDAASNPVAAAVAAEVAAAWTGFGLRTTVTELAPADFVTRLRDGDFAAAVVDVNVGLDPDLSPLLASSQARSGGSNIAGVQDATIDKALSAASEPGTTAQRKKSMSRLQQVLVQRLPILPLVFRDHLYLVPEALEGPTERPLSDPSERFWDVLTWRLADR
ncbi:MAG: ABC transporter substrate-binding protein [Chloroflexi bacterium]|nr:ABC transporter substrate-binding protein [Chloroflexota bacterium]